MKEKFDEMKKYLEDMETDLSKFVDKGQAAAGTRLRKSLSEIKKMAQDLRNQIQEIKSDRKTEK